MAPSSRVIGSVVLEDPQEAGTAALIRSRDGKSSCFFWEGGGSGVLLERS